MDIFAAWVSQPDVCRLCLSTSGSLDITGSYLSDEGTLEVYADMLFDSYGIRLTHISEWGPSRFVCHSCVKSLRDGCNFKKQVLLADKYFNNYYDDMKERNGTNETEDFTDDGNYNNNRNAIDDGHANQSNEENDFIDIIDEAISPQKIDDQFLSADIKENKHEEQDDVEKTNVDPNSDIPLTNPIDNAENKFIVKGLTECEVVGDNVQSYVQGNMITKGPSQLKQLSERKRIIVTCETILKDTTACPFRHHKSWFQCFYCAQDFMEINALREHTLSIHTNVNEEIKKIKRFPRSLQIEISNLKCRHCDLNLTDVNSMRGHFDEVHKKVMYKECIADYKVDSSPYSCHLCEKQFHVFRTLTVHLNEHYVNCICDVCGKSFLNSRRLKVHKRTHELGDYTCRHCGRVLKTKISLANHMETHSKRVLKCHICLMPMKHYNERVKHMSTAHNITHTFSCPICSRVYNVKHCLATHIRQTHGHKDKKCAECGMAFVTNHGLKKHMLKHSGVKAFSCGICCKTYARSYSLKEHMRCHQVEKDAS